MAVFVRSVLPSGKGIWLEKLTTRQFRLAQQRAASSTDPTALNMHTLLLSFKGVTYGPIPWQYKTVEGKEQIDIDAMLAQVADDALWIKPTYEELVIKDGTMSLETLLDEPEDFVAANALIGRITLPNQDKAGSLAGKWMTVSAGQ